MDFDHLKKKGNNAWSVTGKYFENNLSDDRTVV
jgi:hypothetical protein